MNSSVRACLLAALLAGLLSAAPTGEEAAGAYGNRVLVFESHQAAPGEMPSFTAHAAGHILLFSTSGRVSAWGAGMDASGRRTEIGMRLVGARAKVVPQAVGPPAGTANHLVGSPDHWRLGVPLFEKIRYPGLYPGIDLVYYGNQSELEYDFVVAPGALWRSIRLAFSGAQAVEIDPGGDLKLQTRGGWLRHRCPRIYQQLASGRRVVSGHYVLLENRQVGFEIGAYDPRVPLVIDPTLVYSSYLGGNAADNGYSVAVDSSGCAFTVGETWSPNFPLLNPLQGALAGDTDIFVTKWNATGNGIVYSTYIGGSNRDVPLGVAVDAAGNAYIAGFTYSANFPITAGALRSTFSGQSKGFVLKLNPNGNSLVYSTFVGGSGSDYATGIAVDAIGQAYIPGYTASVDFPVSANAFQGFYGGGESDGFFAKLNAAGSQLAYATYLGGIGNDTATAVALDPAGNVYLSGQTQSANFPVYQALQTTNSESDAFVVKLNASNQVLYSTYLGGTGSSTGTGIAADAAGNAYVAGYTTAPDFPVTPGAYQPSSHGGYDTFVAKLSADGSTILAATYFGGSGAEDTSGIALDGSGDVFVAGSTNSTDLPLQAQLQTYSGGGDGFIAAFNNQLTSLYFSTYYGGAESDRVAGIAVDSSGDAYLTGSTGSGGSSLGIPVTTGAFQTLWQGSVDAFLAKISLSGVSPLTCSATSPSPLNIPIGGPAEPVGDVVLTCTGGVVGPLAVADIQFSLNATVASGVQPELLIDNPPPASQVPGVNLFLGTGNGAGSTLFSGVSFTVPGPAAAHTLRITNVQVNAATIPSPGQVFATVSALSSSPSLSVVEPQQMVATAGVELQESVLSGFAAPPNCVAPAAATTFLIGDSQALVWFQVSGAASGDAVRTDWLAPAGAVYLSSALTLAPGPSTQCFWSGMPIAGSTSPMIGAWQVKVYWNNSLLFSAPFSISSLGAGLQYFPVTPCRVADTRRAAGPFGGPAMAANSTRIFSIPSGSCNVPATAAAYALNVTVIPSAPLGFLTIWPTGQPQPTVSTLNSLDMRVKANAALVAAGSGGAVSVFVTGATDLALDINGYFAVPGATAGLAFYPVTPCRVMDTRSGTGPLAGPTLPEGQTRPVPVPASACGIPANAGAYSLNLTVVPAGSLGYISVWPTGAPMAVVSTLNAPTGAVTANAAIVPAGTGGAINVYTTDRTDLIVDINGYFAAAGEDGLAFYIVNPCRAVDTRNPPAPLGGPALSGTRNFPIGTSSCGLPPAAKAYSLNATVVPQRTLGFLTLWPAGGTVPVVSTLNSLDGSVVSNAAVVPAGGGSIDAFATNPTALILDVNGYFAP
jgi:hypothetical protein